MAGSRDILVTAGSTTERDAPTICPDSRGLSVGRRGRPTAGRAYCRCVRSSRQVHFGTPQRPGRCRLLAVCLLTSTLAGAGTAPAQAADQATGRGAPARVVAATAVPAAAVAATAVPAGSPSSARAALAASPGAPFAAGGTPDEPPASDSAPAGSATPADGAGSGDSEQVRGGLDDGEQDGGGRALLGGLVVVGAVLLWVAGVALRGRAAARAERARE